MPDSSDAYALGFGPFGFLPATPHTPYSTLTLPVCPVGKFRVPPELTERHLCDMRNDVFEPESSYKQMGELTGELRNRIVEPHNDNAAKARVTFVLPHKIFSAIEGIGDA